METKKVYFKVLAATLLILAAIPAYSQESRPIVTDINAFPSASNKITVSWNLPVKTSGSYITSLAIYRDTKPITDVSGLTLLATLPYGSVTYTDVMQDYREYFYAVISITRPGSFSQENELYFDEELDMPQVLGDEKPYLLVLPGVNATVQGARVERKQSAPEIQPIAQSQEQNSTYGNSVELREQPLPFIDVLGEPVPEQKLISQEAMSQALTLTGGKQNRKTVSVLEPYIFEEDYVSPSGGDEYLLFEVLKTSFIQKKYSQSINSLERFLALNRTTEVTHRAKFYLGEAYYYTAQYQKAIQCFMDTEEAYPALSKKWMEASLDSFDFN